MPDRPDVRERELRGQTAEIKRSARAVEQSMGQFADSADRRTILAADRSLLAAERTYAAWMRTALAALASGVGAKALVRGVLPDWIGRTTGSILILFAGFCIVAAVWRELHGISKASHPDLRPMPRKLVIPMNVILPLVTLAALIGIWSA